MYFEFSIDTYFTRNYVYVRSISDKGLSGLTGHAAYKKVTQVKTTGPPTAKVCAGALDGSETAKDKGCEIHDPTTAVGSGVCFMKLMGPGKADAREWAAGIKTITDALDASGAGGSQFTSTAVARFKQEKAAPVTPTAPVAPTSPIPAPTTLPAPTAAVPGRFKQMATPACPGSPGCTYGDAAPGRFKQEKAAPANTCPVGCIPAARFKAAPVACPPGCILSARFKAVPAADVCQGVPNCVPAARFKAVPADVCGGTPGCVPAP